MNESVTRRSFNKGNGNNRRRNNEEYIAKKNEMIAKQKVNLEIIDKAAAYLDGILKTDGLDTRITMQQILKHLTEECGITVEDTKVVSQLNYILMELANAQKSQFISGDRVNIRILYFEERLKSAYKKELHNLVDEMLKKYDSLFYWTAVEPEPEEVPAQ